MTTPEALTTVLRAAEAHANGHGSAAAILAAVRHLRDLPPARAVFGECVEAGDDPETGQPRIILTCTRIILTCTRAELTKRPLLYQHCAIVSQVEWMNRI